VLAGLRNLNALEFFNVNDMETMANEEHMMCTAVDWDPNGRFVSTSVSYWRHQLDTGYNIYTFAGKPLYKVLKDKFYQLLWRPRPPTLLSEEQLLEVKTNLSKFEKKYEQEDQQEARRQENEIRKQREALRKEFQNYVASREADYQSVKEERNKLYGRDLEAEEREIEEIEETVEELLDEEEEIEE